MFVKGKRLPRQGGRENGIKGGRPTKLQQEIKRLAAEAVKRYLEDSLKPAVDAYLALATGGILAKKRIKLDPATTRHLIERFVPPAQRSISLDFDRTAEYFLFQVLGEEGIAIDDKTETVQ